MSAFTLTVPASSGNMGAGFDTFGMALSVRNEFSFKPAPEYSLTYNTLNAANAAEKTTIKMHNSFTNPDRNYLVKCYKKCCKKMNLPARPFSLHATVRVPPYGGMGSSATAAIAAAAAAQILNERKPNKEELLAMAVGFERHPDNLAPSLFGGFTISVRHPVTKEYKVHRVPVSRDLLCILILPDLQTSTAAARKTMPDRFTRADLSANLGYAGLTALAFATQNYALLRQAMHDRIHEPYRDKPELGYVQLKQSLPAAGALGVCLSGSGPAILLLAENGKTQKLDAAVSRHFQKRALSFKSFRLQADNRGIQIRYGPRED